MLFIEQENNLSCIIGLSYNFISKTSMSDKNINNSPFNTLKNIVEKDLSHVNELLFSMAKSHDAQLIDKISSHILSAGERELGRYFVWYLQGFLIKNAWIKYI